MKDIAQPPVGLYQPAFAQESFYPIPGSPPEVFPSRSTGLG